MDNQIFSVNGELENVDVLEMTLSLLMKQGGYEKVNFFTVTPKHGFIMHWEADDAVKLPAPCDIKSVVPLIHAWLSDPNTWENAVFGDWQDDAEHDGHNKKGWEVYIEEWNQVNEVRAIGAVRPCWLWYGK